MIPHIDLGNTIFSRNKKLKALINNGEKWKPLNLTTGFADTA